MIKIQQHLDRGDADVYLDKLALSMWVELNPTILNGEFHYNSLIKKLERLILKSTEKEYFVKIANNNSVVLKRQKDFLNYLLDNNCDKLKSLITFKPDLLQNLKTEILSILKEDDLFYSYQGGYKQTSFGELLIEKLFSYKNFRKSSFCRKLMIDAGYQNVTCPYCNYNRVSIVDISTETDLNVIYRAYFDLDHFFSKSQNPFFAISFYNLIPSCHDCNSIEKKDLVFDLSTNIHPYVQSFNEQYRFEINPDFFLTSSTDIINLTYIGGSVDYNNRDFKLFDRYQGIHISEVNRLIKLYIDYQNYRNSPDYGYDWKLALLQNVPIESKLILGRPQGKLLRDVIKQIDIYGLIND